MHMLYVYFSVCVNFLSLCLCLCIYLCVCVCMWDCVQPEDSLISAGTYSCDRVAKIWSCVRWVIISIFTCILNHLLL